MPRRKNQSNKKGKKAENGTSDAARPRPFWSGTISFGLVSIPVDLYPATRREHVPLRTLSPDHVPLRREYYDPETESAIESDDIVRGYEVERDTFVPVTDEELEALEPEKSRDIDLRQFVDESELSPMLFEQSYLLAPSGDSSKAYRLLEKTLEDSGLAGVATFVLRGNEKLVAIRAREGLLRATVLRFADAVRTPEDAGLPERSKPKSSDVTAMKRAISGLTARSLDQSELVDEETKKLRELVETKSKAGRDVVESPTAPADGQEASRGEVIDLFEALKRSLEKRNGSTGGKRAARTENLANATKQELYERAKALDIEGRSQMSKAQLIRAIDKAG